MSGDRALAALIGSRWGVLAAGVLSLAAVAAALVSQHRYGLEPCPWCILQRMIFIAIGALCLLTAAWPGGNLNQPTWRQRLPASLFTALTGVLALCGVAAAVYQNQVASRSNTCKLSLADRIITGSGLDQRWPEVFEVRATCADAVAALLGVPIELWSGALYLALAAFAFTRLAARRA